MVCCKPRRTRTRMCWPQLFTDILLYKGSLIMTSKNGAWLETANYPWTPDQGDGNFRNPILCADYSDPDVIRHGDDFYLIASSFNCTPALPILHSQDLVNWSIIG